MQPMKNIIFCAAIFCAISGNVSCKKKDEVKPAAFEASYHIRIQMSWASPAFTVPANAHFTTLAGMIHSADTFLWPPQGPATVGLEYLAEVGSNWRLNNELDTVIGTGKAMSRFELAAPAITGSIDTVLLFNQHHSCISFASMIAPSPDWFAGLNTIDLFGTANWPDTYTVPLYLYDAGTENGNVFGYDNPPTMPATSVQLLTPALASVLMSGPAIVPIGTVTFTKN